jgi:hypothetical protein
MPVTSPTRAAEWSILLAACSVAPREQKSSRLRTLLTQPFNWNSLFELADRHGVRPLLYQSFLQQSFLQLEESAPSAVRAPAVPDNEMQRLKQAYYINVQKTLLLSRELLRIIEKLSAIGIDVMPYKGLALAEMLYHDITLRQSGDIDLLIRPQDLPRIRTAVAELGYVPHAPLSAQEEQQYLKSGYECAFDSPAGRNLLEVQWAIQPRFYAIDFDMPAIFQRAITVTVADHPLKTPSAADLLLILSAHAAKHVWDKLAWLCDIARLMSLPDLDWKWIASEARRLGIVRILWVTMLAANRLLDAPIPAAAQSSLPPDSAAHDLANEIAGYIVSEKEYVVDSPAYFRLMMRLRERQKDRLRFLQRLIFTPGPSEWQAVRLPRPLFPLYRLVRLSRLAARFVRA